MMPRLAKTLLTHPLLISILLSICLHLSVIQVLGTLYFNESKNAISFTTPNKFSVVFSPNDAKKQSTSKKNSQLDATSSLTAPGPRNHTPENNLSTTSQKVSQEKTLREYTTHSQKNPDQMIESGQEGISTGAQTKMEQVSESPSQNPSTALKNTSISSDSNTNQQIEIDPNTRSTVFVQNIEYLHMEKPKYPALAKRLRQEGIVKLLVLIDFEGKPKVLKIQESSEYSILDNAALKAVKKWRFKPHVVGKKPVEAWAIVPIDFDLRQAKR